MPVRFAYKHVVKTEKSTWESKWSIQRDHSEAEGSRTHWKTWRNKWSLGRHSEFRVGALELSGCGGLEPSRARAQEL